jgi:hypothetical protein
MAKQEVAVKESSNIAVVGEALPDYLRDYAGPSGTDNIDTQDVSIPRLKLGQSMTDEVKEKKVDEGDFFHSITKEKLIQVGNAGLIIPIAYAKEYILWRDLNDGGGIFARARRVQLPDGSIKYAWDKPGQTFEHKVKGVVPVKWKTGQYIEDDGLANFGSSISGDQESQPAATAHFNYIVAMPDKGFEVLAVSLSRSSAKKAKDWNAMLKMGNAPMFARIFNLMAIPDANDQGQKYFNYGITPAGFLQDQQMFESLRKLHNELKDKGVAVDWSDEESKPAGGSNEKEQF